MTYDQAELLLIAVNHLEAALWAVSAGVWAHVVLGSLFELVKLGRVIWAARVREDRRRRREEIALAEAIRRGAA